MLAYFAIGLVVISLFLYALLFMIECGATVLIASPRLSDGRDDGVYAYIGPVWETTNVFLIFALVSFIAFFPGAVPIWGSALAVPFLLFLAVTGVRVVFMLYVFYHRAASRAIRVLLAVFALAAPAVFAGAIVPFFLTGEMPYGSAAWLLAAVLAAFTLAATLLISSSFFSYLETRRRGSIETKAAGWRFVRAVLVFAIPFFGMAFAQLPYIVYPSAALTGSFANPAAARVLFAAFAAGFILVMPSLMWLFRLSIGKRRQ